MRKGGILSFVAVTVLCASCATVQPSTDADPIQEALVAAERLSQAFLSGDIGLVEAMTAEEYLQTDVEGHIQNRAEWLHDYYYPVARRLKGGERFQVYERKIEATRLIGGTVVMAGSLRLDALTREAATPESPFGTIRFTQVWLKRNGIWQRCVTHNAWAPKRKSE